MTDQNKKQPFFGANAKPFFIQMAFVIICVAVLIPLAKPYIKPFTDGAVNGTLDGFCFIGLCTQEAAERQSASERQQ